MSITTEQAAAWFEERAKNTPMPGTKAMFEVAAVALKKQIPMEPVIYNEHWHNCPVCGTYSGGLRAPFCHSCGQSLKWEE